MALGDIYQPLSGVTHITNGPPDDAGSGAGTLLIGDVDPNASPAVVPADTTIVWKYKDRVSGLDYTWDPEASTWI